MSAELVAIVEALHYAYQNGINKTVLFVDSLSSLVALQTPLYRIKNPIV